MRKDWEGSGLNIDELVVWAFNVKVIGFPEIL